jgi:hypothetical protein
MSDESTHRGTAMPTGWCRPPVPRCIYGLLSYQQLSFAAALCLSGSTHRGAASHRLRCGNTHTIELRAPNVGQRFVARSQEALSPHGNRSLAWRTRTLHQMKAEPERLGLAHHGYLFMPLGVGSVEV